MASVLGFASRMWHLFYPPQAAKKEDAIRIGLLGASKIAPRAVILPAKSHPEVIIAAIAARDDKKGQAFANKHGIPIVHKSYQDLIDDPAIDAIYIPLPNGLHYEWTLKSLKAGKHVLLEKPSTSNASEASSLFRHPLLSQPNAPILLEAFHPIFHPAWQTFLSLLDPPNIASAHATMFAPSFQFPKDDIRFIYELAGGALMDAGTYCVLFLRQMFGAEPEDCIEAIPRLMPAGYDQKCDQAMKASWRFPNGGVGSMETDLAVPLWGNIIPWCEATHKEVVVDDEGLTGIGNEHVVVRKVSGSLLVMPVLWHRIDIITQHTIRNRTTNEIVKTWEEKECKKAYTWEEFNGEKVGEDWWITYRWMLEEFVNRIKGRKGTVTGVWMGPEESVRQMEMIDSGYVKAGMALRPSSTFQL